MGERLILVCDVCGKAASETVTIRAGSKTVLKDLCSTHLGELLSGTRAPKRGRRRAAVAAPSETAPTTPARRTRSRRAGGTARASAKARRPGRRSSSKTS
jgi:hypothetical protein